MTEIIDFLKKYTDGKQNAEKVEISVLQLKRVIKALEQELTTLEDIKAEIKEIAEPDYVYHGCGSDEMICEMKDVFEIIDRYITGKE